MIKEIATQDKMISGIASSPDPIAMNPTHYKDIMNSLEKHSWLLAIKDKLSSMNEESVFKVVEMKSALQEVKPDDILSTRLVFSKKQNPDRFKARQVAWGFRKTRDVNFPQTFAPTPTFGVL
ncbi:hypothetical protein O181_105294 [Austropuccinia psidii MF-1]|uniref:Reverse transcriptase Ty1/copia-type domain-containing protein n=1 Tax=Austropuccinia psidii MF-1 TaxID=1389203 RepID=A0A9Q3PKZ2_9BASI|nr:hypothetical protein [Austropuccinia psidii MF-1]